MEIVHLDYLLLHPASVEEAWPLVGPWVVQAIGNDADVTDVEYIKAQAQRGNCQLWIGYKDKLCAETIEVVLICEAAFYCNLKTLVLRWLSGKNMDNWIEHLPVLENWASANGFLRMEVWGRFGWKHVLKPHGYRHGFTQLYKFLPRSIH